MKKSLFTIILFSFLFSSCDPIATATICNKSKNEIFVFIEFDKNYLLERTDLKERSEAVASTDLLATISGCIEEACHDVSFSDAMKMDAANSKNSLGSQIVA